MELSSSVFADLRVQSLDLWKDVVVMADCPRRPRPDLRSRSPETLVRMHGHKVWRCRRCIGHAVGTPAGPIQGRKVTDKEGSEHYKQTMLEERRTRCQYAIFCCCIVNVIYPLRRSRRESANGTVDCNSKLTWV